jgi:acyl-coenzyme A synthetase/AMP-(fatty) acid ligase
LLPLRPSKDIKRLQTIDVFSGGSTGSPKKMTRPVQSWLDSLGVETHVFGLTGYDRYGILGSDSHSLWAYAMFRAEHTGALCVGLRGSPREQFRSIALQRLSVLYAITPLLNLFCRYAFASGQTLLSVEKIIAGGAAWPEGLALLCKKVFPKAEVHCFYGSVELGYVGHAKPNEPMWPFPGVEVHSDEQQQLWARSALTIAPMQWLASGDRMAWADQIKPSSSASQTPNARAFHVLGRVDRLINQAGIKIQPEPIEEELQFALDCTELAVVGLPDHLRGERIGLILGPALKERYLKVREAFQALPHAYARTLTGAKIIQLDHWPRLANGKLSLEELKKEALQKILASDQSNQL